MAVPGSRPSWQMGYRTSHFSCVTNKPDMYNKHDKIFQN